MKKKMKVLIALFFSLFALSFAFTEEDYKDTGIGRIKIGFAEFKTMQKLFKKQILGTVKSSLIWKLLQL